MTTTHEQTARNAEIVQRRLAGEATGALALEYQVTATRIAQLVRRHREKIGEIPTRPRVKAKPRKREPREVRAAGAPRRKAVQVPMPIWPEQPYTGPVTVVPGTQVAARPFSMLAAMALAAARARAEQTPLRSLAGIRERRI
ncbi:hypothetical protein [Achromobacter xylosoxidans]|uniref:hypothetical protein n=1 Tax=Alcaligenes xylosoxydans xylosoxydans TaxID=85698 RepID=UPI002A751EA8|nr:hypothetical protein [Achromobacter xylosoxidans]WPQ34363.1 hypothetical protein SLH34_27735 [Achromobacter xylosoxidans]